MPALPVEFTIDGVNNFRDQGGYGVGGSVVTLGCLYRSGHYANITDAGIEALAHRNIDLVIDLRDDYERQAFLSRPIGIATEYHGGRLFEFADEYDEPPNTGQDVMARKIRSYERFHTRFHSGVNAVFSALADGKTALVHCTAGKDRTGFVGALALALLGVDMATIQADYMVSQANTENIPQHEKDRINKFYGLDDNHAHIVDMRRKIYPQLISHALASVTQAHGSIEAYLTGPCGMSAGDVSAVKDRLLG